MEYMLLFFHHPGTPSSSNETKGYARALQRAGKLPSGVTVDAHADVTWVRVRDGRVLRKDIAAADSGEIISGFWIVDAADRAEAIAIAQRCPHAQDGTVEVHRLLARHISAASGGGKPFLYTFHVAPGLTDVVTKMQEMRQYGEALEGSGKLSETAPLAFDFQSARIQVRNTKVLVTDGPFAESKEGVGGYAFSYLASRAEAVDIAERYPHAKWGPVELREALAFEPS
jgi:hypothetical protein